MKQIIQFFFFFLKEESLTFSCFDVVLGGIQGKVYYMPE